MPVAQRLPEPTSTAQQERSKCIHRGGQTLGCRHLRTALYLARMGNNLAQRTSEGDHVAIEGGIARSFAANSPLRLIRSLAGVDYVRSRLARRQMDLGRSDGRRIDRRDRQVPWVRAMSKVSARVVPSKRLHATLSGVGVMLWRRHSNNSAPLRCWRPN